MNPARTSQLQIRTPEGITFSLLLAGPVSRFLAWAMDMAAVAAIGTLIGTALSLLDLLSVDLSRALRVLVYFILQVGYTILFEWLWRGQTIGKRLLRLRVMDVQGLRLQFSQVAIRNLLRFVDMLPAFYLLGGLSCLLNRRGQRLGDLAANTIVVRQPRIEEPDLDQVLAGKYNSLRDQRHLVARLQQRVSPDEARVGLQAVLRRDDLTPEARLQLFREIAGHYRGIVEFPPEATEGITDEQYVRNVVDVLFRRPERERGSDSRRMGVGDRA